MAHQVDVKEKTKEELTALWQESFDGPQSTETANLRSGIVRELTARGARFVDMNFVGNNYSTR